MATLRNSPSTKIKMDERDYVQSLERGLAILQAFDIDHPTLSLSEAAVRTGLTRAAARRFLLTLARLGYVGTNGKRFWLRPKILDIGYSYLANQPWWQIAQPIMEEISRTMQESCSICVLDDNDIVYVCRVAVNRFVSTNLTIGSRLPAYPTALGRVLLSQLPDEELRHSLSQIKPEKLTRHTVTDKRKLRALIEKAHADGYSFVDQELDLGLRALAVPVSAEPGIVLASMGVSVQANRMTGAEMLKRYLPALQDGSARIMRGITQNRRAQLTSPRGLDKVTA